VEKKEEKAIVPFVDLNLHPNIEEGLKAMGFENATPIQSEQVRLLRFFCLRWTSY
jgi:superfamily II DNA/RNA helicase